MMIVLFSCVPHKTGAAVCFLFLFPVTASIIVGGHPLENADVHSDRYTDNHATSARRREQARQNREKQTNGERGRRRKGV
jgi:hypothetical protein